MEAEVPLLKQYSSKWRTVAGELSRVILIALPMIVVTITQYILRVSPMFMLGHLGQLSLSAASLATSFCNVTGFSFGMSSALETLCGQAYGGKQHERVWSFTYAAILCLFLICIPISVVWVYTEKLLVFVGQDPLISAEAGKYAIRLIPTLFPYALLQALVRYLQTQTLILPMFWSALASLCIQLPLCWAFLFKFNLGNAGAALSIGISYWLNVILLVLYVMFSPTRASFSFSFSKDVVLTMKDFSYYAIPSAGMVCLEWWSFEIIILLSGLLPNPQLQTSVLSICLTMTSLHYHVPYSFSAAASTLVANELGAGKPERARVAVYAVLALAAAEFLIASGIIYACRHILGYAFSEEKEFVDYVEDMTPFLCLSIILDSLQTVLSGVARGTGWQHMGAYVNLGSYYLVGIPVALLLGFALQLQGEGLWTGLVAGTTVQALSLSLITALTNWDKQAREARQRIFTCKSLDEITLSQRMNI
ncbi:MATE efflux family protein [Perilla frutescens var. hirtella]|nr:MATE efflux family protein [Perilla frutescens var. hirtella]